MHTYIFLYQYVGFRCLVLAEEIVVYRTMTLAIKILLRDLSSLLDIHFQTNDSFPSISSLRTNEYEKKSI